MHSEFQSIVIEAKDLSKNYADVNAVNSLTFNVFAGEVFGLLGPNGAGKTTLVEMLSGLTTPSYGTARVLGFDICGDLHDLKSQIGIQLQSSSYHQYLTLKEIIELFASFYGISINPLELLDLVGLKSRATSRIKHLSGGMAQRFSIAAALVNSPKLIFLDEPTSGLDPEARRSIWELINQIKTRGTTVLLTTHYMEEAELLCDRVAFLNQGKIIALDSPKELINSLNSQYSVEIHMSKSLNKNWINDFDNLVDLNIFKNHGRYIIKFKISDVVTVIQEIAALTAINEVEIFHISINSYTLDDVFLTLTGETLLGDVDK
tara:strand:- start:1536 stop:2492 length:957 start_codon:yes stop_codon:yes gene_type:complete